MQWFSALGFAHVLGIAAALFAADFAAAQEEETQYVDAGCCICGSFFKTDDEGVGFNHDYIGLCGECANNFEMRYGSLEQALEDLGLEARELGRRGREARSAYNTALNDYNQASERIWGFSGSAARFFNGFIGVVSFWPGTAWAYGFVQSGVSIGQGVTDWRNWGSGIGGGISNQEFLDTVEKEAAEAYEKAMQEAREALARDSDVFAWLGRTNQASLAYRESVKGLRQLRRAAPALTYASLGLNVWSFGEATNDFSNDLVDRRVALAEMARLEEELNEIDRLIQGIIDMRTCIMGEIANRHGDGGGEFDPERSRQRPRGPYAQAFFPNVRPGDPPDGAAGLDLPPSEPLPRPEPPQPPAGALLSAEKSLESLKGDIESLELTLGRDVIPAMLELTRLAFEGDESDAERIRELSAATLPLLQGAEEDYGRLIRNARAILQGVHNETANLGDDDDDRGKFAFVDSAVTFHIADWVPPYDTFGWRGLAPAGAGYAGRSDIVSSDDLRLVPPGVYDILWAQNVPQWQRPTVWKTVEIKEGETLEIRIDSGAKIDPAAWVVPIDTNWGWWGAAPTADAQGGPTDWNARINWDARGDVPIVLPPGQYDIYWAQGLYQRDRPAKILANVTISAGELKSIALNTGMRLTGDPEMDDYGWWAIVPVGGGEDDWINISKGVTDHPLVVAPGTYDILFNGGLGSETVRIAEKVTVKAGQLLEVTASQ